MKKKEDLPLSSSRDLWTLGAVMGLGLLLAGSAIAQDYRTLSGASDRAGRAVVQPGNVNPETTWNNAGRGFLRWWDPIFETGSDLDNDEAGTTAIGTWIDPAPFGLPNPNIELAPGYIQNDILAAPYRVAVTSASGLATSDDPSAGNTAVYEWELTGLVPGENYSIEVNVPVGPTNIDPAGTDVRFNNQFFGYEVEDAAGTRVYWVDTFRDGGGLVALDDAIFEPDGLNRIQVRLFNTVLTDGFGNPVSGFDFPGSTVVYGDYVQAIGRGTDGEGGYSASPVVGELVNPSFTGNPTVFDQRVVSARNEAAFIGALNRSFNVGVVTSFTHNGDVVDPFAPLRRNMVWSWPAVRPFELTTASRQQYEVDRQAWLLGAPNSNYPRYSVFRQRDNLSPGSSFSGSFAASTTFTRRGPDHLLSAPSLSRSGNSTWTSNMEEGFYFVEIYLPTDDAPGDLATRVTYEIRRGANVVSTVAIDQSSFNGWTRLPFQPEEGFENTEALPLSVTVYDQTTADNVTNGRQIYADAVRFVGDADLSISSTPIMVSATIDDGSTTQPRDVVVVARENGRLYCMDAHGDETTGAQPAVYWVYPSENPIGDPNEAALEDYGIATMPTEFDLSSAFTANVGGEDLLYIGGQNGKVYCLEMTGRGDGTTRRRWTYPDDFNPANPTVQMSASTLGPIEGSLAFADVAGTPAVIVPSSNGRVIALDAAGDAATRTTTELWSYPPAASPALGELTMSPVVAFGNIYFAAADASAPAEGVMHAIDEDTGTVVWTRNTRQDGTTPFGTFGRATPTAIPGTLVPALGGQDIVVFVDTDTNAALTAVNAASGAVVWEDLDTITGGVQSALSFVHMRQYNSLGTLLLDAVPSVLVATVEGELYGFYADGTVNANGSRRHWGDFLEGDAQVASFATGGWPNNLAANRSHIYIGDSQGILYAYSSVDDDGSSPPITPGRRPGERRGDENDPDLQALRDMMDRAEIVLISPSQYREILSASRQAGGVTQAMVTAIQGQNVDRRFFEMGESVYVAVTRINNSTVPETSGYRIEVDVDTGISSTRPISVTPIDITGAADPLEGAIAIAQYQLRADGSRGMRPGGTDVEVRARVDGGRTDEEHIIVSTDPTQVQPPGRDLTIAHPLGVEFLNGSMAGVGVASNDPTVTGNAPLGYNAGNAATMPAELWTGNFANGNTSPLLPGQRLSTTTNPAAPEFVPHGTDAITIVNAYDRSMLFLVFGDGRSASGRRAGIQNVRWRPSDLSWQPVNNPANLPDDGTSPAYPKQFDPTLDLGVVNPLNLGNDKSTWAYGNFEDYPLFYPNRSLDYPDLTRGGLMVTKSELGDAGNPVFDGGVDLTPPDVLTADLTAYLTTFTGYNDGLVRTEVETPMNVRWNVPKYQPASFFTGGNRAGYSSRQTLYVDSGNNGFEPNETYRQFIIAVNVAEDQRMSTSTPTVDLGSTPAGGGWNGGAGNTPESPQSGASAFRPNVPAFSTGDNAQFQPFSVFNDGNTNLLNVRLAKGFAEWVGGTKVTRPMELFAPGDHQLAWLDAGYNMVSNLDPGIAPPEVAGLTGTYSQVKLQKSRPGDVASTRLSTNPVARSNANLGVTGAFLLDPTIFEPGDPMVGVAPPIGTPVGSYERQIFAINDLILSEDGTNRPVLGPLTGVFDPTNPSFEPYTDPGITLKFNVRESRLTNRPTTKAAPNIENVLGANDDYAWANRQPAALRAVNGDLVVAWASNRLDAGLPSYAITGSRSAASLNNRNTWRIYLSTLAGTSPYAGGFGNIVGPNRDLNVWLDQGNTWFGQGGVIPGNGQAAGLFAATLAPNETVPNSANEATYRFHSPAFPSMGDRDPMSASIPRAGSGTTAMAFIGETQINDATGQRRDVHQLFVLQLGLGGGGAVTPGAYSAMPFDRFSRKSQPAIAQSGGLYVIYYTSFANGLGELKMVTFNPNTQVWSQPVNLNIGGAYDDVSSPSVVLRRSENSNVPAANVFFTGKVRGQQNSETYMGQMTLGNNGLPTTTNPWRIYEDRYEQLQYDPKTKTYRASGLFWSMTGLDLDNLEIGVRGAFAGNNYRRIGIGTNPDVIVDGEAAEITMDSEIGGKVYIDATNGTVRLSGVPLPQNATVYLRYSPRLLRVSGAISKAYVQPDNDGNPFNGRIASIGGSVGANYRGTSAAFDDRYIGVNLSSNPSERLLEDQNYWFFMQSGTDAAAIAVDPNLEIRHDRFTVVSNRTSNDGSAATRPFMSTMRIGVELPSPVGTDSNGNILAIDVEAVDAPTNAGELWYQVDPVNGKVYFTSDMEGKRVNITYQTPSVQGQPSQNFTVSGVRPGPIFEKGEVAVPIEQVGNDSDVTIFTDPFTSQFNNQRRAPILWMFWTSTRGGVPDVYFQTIAPKTAPVGPAN